MSLEIPLPPLVEQQRIAEVLDRAEALRAKRRAAAVEKLKTAHRASLGELDALFVALQHRAFRGEL